MSIHPTAVIEKGATLAGNAKIGPYCVVGPDVTLAENVVLHAHVVVTGHTSVGEGTQVFPFTSLGSPPQDLKFKGEKTTLTIGRQNVIREHVTMNPGTSGGGGNTVVGDHCLFMVGSHIAHDCQIGNHVILANNATLAGHVEVGDHAIIGGLAAVHQFVRIGRHAIIGGLSGVEHDVIPYGSVMGERAALAGLNLVGLKRRGFDRDTIHALRNFYKMVFEENDGTLAERVKFAAEAFKDEAVAEEILAFLSRESKRSFCVPKTLSA